MAKQSFSRADIDIDEDLLGEDDASAESEEDLVGLTTTSMSKAVVWGTDWTAATIVDQLHKQNISLAPVFQRRDAWTDERKSLFVESLIMGLPIPQIVLAEQKAKGKFIVIDGKQRLLSLSKFTGIGLAPGQKHLILKGLKIWETLNGHTYADLKNNPKFSDLVSAFDNQSIRTVVIRGWKSDEVLYTIFHRLNTGSLPLSPQELRQALHPGPFLNFVADFSEKNASLRKMLGLTQPDFRMRDVELVVRFYAFHLRLSEYGGNLKKFLDDTCDKLNKQWKTDEDGICKVANTFQKSIEAAMKIFPRGEVFRKWEGSRFEKQLNRAVFDVVAHSLANDKLRSGALKHKEQVQKLLKRLCNDQDFRASIESTTKSKQAVTTRFRKWYSGLNKVTRHGVSVALPK